MCGCAYAMGPCVSDASHSSADKDCITNWAKRALQQIELMMNFFEKKFWHFFIHMYQIHEMFPLSCNY